MQQTTKTSRAPGRNEGHHQITSGSIKERPSSGNDRHGATIFGFAYYLLTVSRDDCPWRRRVDLYEEISIDLPSLVAARMPISPKRERYP